MRTLGSLLISGLLQIVWMTPAMAVRHDVYESQLWNPNRVAAIVKEFQDNDTVVFHPKRGSERVFQLGKFLDQGSLGKVFFLRDTQPPQVVKFPLGGFQNRTQWAMKKQRQAYEAMDREQIPHPKLHDFNDSFFLDMDEVIGPTLGASYRDWFNITREERKDFLKALDSTLASLRTSEVGFNDLNSANIMYDKVAHQVLVVDPGNVVPNDERTLKNIYSWINANDQIFNAWTVRDNPQALEKVLTLQERRHAFITQPSEISARFLLSEMGGFTPDKLTGLPAGIKDEIAQSILLMRDERLRSIVPPSDLIHTKDTLKFILQDPQISYRTRQDIVFNLTRHCKNPSDFLGLLNLATSPYVDRDIPASVSFDYTVEQFLKEPHDPQVIEDFYRSLPHPELKRQMLFKLAVQAKTTSAFFNVFDLPAGPLSVREEVAKFRAMYLASNFLDRLDGSTFANLLNLRAKAQPQSLDPQVQKVYLDFYRSVSAMAIKKSTTNSEILQVFNDPQIAKIAGLKREMASLVFQYRNILKPGIQSRLIAQLGPINYAAACVRDKLSELMMNASRTR